MAEKPVKYYSSPHPPPEMFWNAKPPHILSHIKVISRFRRGFNLNAKLVRRSTGVSGGGRPAAAAHAHRYTHTGVGRGSYLPPHTVPPLAPERGLCRARTQPWRRQRHRSSGRSGRRRCREAEALRGLRAAFLQVEAAIRLYICPYFAQTVTHADAHIRSACLYPCVYLICKHFAFVRVRVPHLERAQIP